MSVRTSLLRFDPRTTASARRLVAVAAPLLVAALASSCRDDRPGAVPAVHPTADNLVPIAPHVTELDRGDSITTEAGLLDAARALRRLELAFYIGSDRDSLAAFATVVDAAVSPRGTIKVLDRGLGRLAAYDAGGRFLWAGGDRGAGDTLLDSPQRLLTLDDGTIGIVEAGSRIRYYAAEEDRLTYRGTQRFADRVEGACGTRTHLYVRGADSLGNMVRRVDDHGDVVRRFAPGYRSPSPLLRMQLSRGRIACEPVSKQVVVAMNNLPFVTAYDSAGAPTWAVVLTGFRPARSRYRESPEGVKRDRSGAYDQPLSLMPVAPNVVMLQVGHMDTQRERGDIPRASTYVLSTRTGAGLYVGDSVPLLASFSGERGLSIELRPYSRVGVYDVAR